MTLRRLGATVAALALVAAGCVAPPGGPTPPASEPGVLTWQPCGEAECAGLRVPLDHAHPGAGTVVLPVKRVRATREPRLGTIVVNPGGPGASGVAYAGAFPRRGLEQFDIVGWDPRGLGGASRVRCLADADADAFFALDFSPDTPDELAALAAGARRFGQACHDHNPDALGQVSTQASARDLDLLRAALGEERLVYYGASYGTLLGALYAELFPDRVGRLVLDSPVDPNPTPAVSQAVGFERAWRAFATWCAAGNCPWGDTPEAVTADVRAWVSALDADPLPVGDRWLTQSLAGFGMASQLYGGPTFWPLLRDALVEARAGDGRALLAAAGRLFGRSDTGRYAPMLGASHAIACADRPRPTTEEVVARWRRDREAAPLFGELLGPDLTCVAWPTAPAPWVSPRAEGAPPILVVGVTGDSATPYEWATELAGGLASARLLTLDGVGHIGYGRDDCVDAAVRAYLVDGRLPEVGARCG